ncbi:hypothetical protein BTTAP_20257 [Brochothrix thermosphacta]|nr:hypothetical protein BTTAP_20257 [Brochothrix thermosphacta]
MLKLKGFDTMIANIIGPIIVFLSITVGVFGLLLIIISLFSKTKLSKYGLIFIIVGILMYAATFLFNLIDSSHY